MIKRALRAAFHSSGALAAARWLKRGRLRILMYHRFHERRDIERQCRHIRAHYTPVSLTEAANWLESGGWPPNALAVTVDDGYRDFYQVAYPVFREYGIPATVYLVSDFLDGREWLWLDRVRWMFLHSPKIPGTREQRLRAALAANEKAKRLPNQDRLAWLRALPGEMGVEPPEACPEQYAPMTWEQVREAAAHGIDFGGHTRSHPVLSMLSGEPELTAEIAGSKRRIEEQLGKPVEHFCYPNGSLSDFTDAAVKVVRAANFRTATTTVPGLVLPAADAFRLSRLGVDPIYDDRYFAECAAGLH
jgi:peptidoglycan/xylan/chitin deacetylase (PgdA/CDA1 family)